MAEKLDALTEMKQSPKEEGPVTAVFFTVGSNEDLLGQAQSLVLWNFLTIFTRRTRTPCESTGSPTSCLLASHTSAQSINLRLLSTHHGFVHRLRVVGDTADEEHEELARVLRDERGKETYLSNHDLFWMQFKEQVVESNTRKVEVHKSSRYKS